MPGWSGLGCAHVELPASVGDPQPPVRPERQIVRCTQPLDQVVDPRTADHLNARLGRTASPPDAARLCAAQGPADAPPQSIPAAAGFDAFDRAAARVADVDAAMTDRRQRNPVIGQPDWPLGESETIRYQLDIHAYGSGNGAQ